MVKITDKGLLIEIETPSPHDQLDLLTRSLLQVLADYEPNYVAIHDPRLAICSFIEYLLPDVSQLEHGIH